MASSMVIMQVDSFNIRGLGGGGEAEKSQERDISRKIRLYDDTRNKNDGYRGEIMRQALGELRVSMVKF